MSIHLIVLSTSLMSFDVFYFGFGADVSHVERSIIAFCFCGLLYGVVASFIEDLLRPGLTRFQAAQSGVSLAVFGAISLLNVMLRHKIVNHVSLERWELVYADWLGAVFFLLAVVLRIAVPLSLLSLRRPKPDGCQ